MDQREVTTLSEQWKTKKVRWQAVAAAAGILVVVALILFWGQRRDQRILEQKQETLQGVKLSLQQERDDKLQETRMADSAEYLAQRARENGYLLPGEIRFVITNLDELIENGGEAETEIAEEGL